MNEVLWSRLVCIKQTLEPLLRALSLPIRLTIGHLIIRLPNSRFFFRPSHQQDIYMALGIWEPYIRTIFTPEPGDVVMDIGAHIGFYTVWAAEAVGPYGHVISVEPDPRNQCLLKLNIQASGHRNITLLNGAISSTDGKRLFALSENPLLSQLTGERTEDGRRTALVDTYSLDSACKKLGFNHIDWIKVDVESGVLDVLKGGNKVLQTNKNAIIEVHDTQTLEYLSELGYTVRKLTSSFDVDGYYYATRT